MKVNRDYPTLGDEDRAQESEEFAEYDTGKESTKPSISGGGDPFRKHAKHIHQHDQDVVASDNSGEIKAIMDKVIKKVAMTLTPGEECAFSSSSTVGKIKYIDPANTFDTLVDMPLTKSSMRFSPAIFSSLGPSQSAIVSAISTKRNVNTFSKGAVDLDPGSHFLDIEVLDKNGDIMVISDTPEPITIIIAHDSAPMEYFVSDLHIPSWSKMYYTTVNTSKAHSAITVELKPFDDSTVNVLLVVKMGEYGNIEKGICDVMTIFPRTIPGEQWKFFMDAKKVNSFIGTIWFGWRALPPDYDTNLLTSCDDIMKLDVNETENIDLELSISAYTSACYYYHVGKKDWVTDGCTVSSLTNSEECVCECSHLTTFAGGWAVAPNAIDWNFVFSNMDFYKNPTIYITEIVILAIFLLTVIWARRKDRKDMERLGLTPLQDNDPKDKYYYEVVVVTGMRRNAGTDSKVFVILSGEYDETDPRLLNDQKRKIMRRGNVDSFLMAVPEPLGSLNYARVWHDNSGTGKFSSWYLKCLIVRDVQTEEKFVFICNRWFAVEEDDGQVDRVVPVAGMAQMTEFSHLFAEKSRKNLVDGHLWFSVVARPPQSRFTCVQRVSCCLCLLYATMLANAMFYGIEDESGTSFTFGPFALSPQQIYVGIMSNLVVFPPTFIVILLFRKSRARKLRPSRLEEALKKMPNRRSASMTDVKPEVEGIWNTGVRPGSSTERPGSSRNEARPGSRVSMAMTDKKKKKWELPWYCCILSWILLWALTLTSAAFVTFYGIMFQDEKCKKWITSMLVSFFMSIFITQPIKVFLTAIVFSLIWKSPDEDDEEADDEEKPKLAYDEEYLHSGESMGAARPRKIGYKPPDPFILEAARKQRLNEIKMWDIIREIVLYSFFLWILMVISYRNRSPHGFYYKDTMEKMVIKNNHTNQWFTKIINVDDFWKWAQSGLVKSVRASSYYNQDPPLLLRGYIGDKVSRIMGYATMRQLRVKRALCKPIPVMSPVIKECNEAYSLFSEDEGSYDAGWETLPGNMTARMEYEYRSASSLNGYPYWGKLEVYGGGGYIVELRESEAELLNKMIQLENETWIDRYTRAIFIEFTVYNPQVNLFTVATILAEFQSSGGVLTSYRFEPAMLLPYMSSVMLFQIVCEVIYVIFTIVFIVREIRNILKEGRQYLKSFWNLVEISLIACSIGAIVVYFYRLFVTNDLTSEFKEHHGDKYQKFQYAGYWNEIFNYMLGWLTFFGTIKFLKLLRFNKRMSLLSSVLKTGASSILHYGLIFGIVYLAYIQLFYLTFKNVSIAFTTFITSAESGVLMMMGKFDIYGMLMVQPVLTQIYVFFFVVTVTFILVNMFLSILNETFTSVRGNIKKQNNDYEIVDFMVIRFKKWTGMGSSPANSTSPTVENGHQIKREPTVEEFPDRIDRLLNSISNVYMDDQLEAILESNGETGKKAAMKNMMKAAPRSTSGPSF